jgi:THO complex subunit 2
LLAQKQQEEASKEAEKRLKAALTAKRDPSLAVAATPEAIESITGEEPAKDVAMTGPDIPAEEPVRRVISQLMTAST